MFNQNNIEVNIAKWFTLVKIWYLLGV